MRVSDEPKPSQNGSAKNSTQNGPFVPDRTAKPPLASNTSLSKEEQSQIHSEAAAVMEKARQEQEKRRLEEERREREQKELKERLEREESEKRKKEEEEGRQEKKKLERQKAEEEEDKENRAWEEKERRGKEQSSDTPSKSMSLDSPAPNHIVSEIKVSSALMVSCAHHTGRRNKKSQVKLTHKTSSVTKVKRGVQQTIIL